ncbi:MAG: photosystem II complex extrinsic protein PsbU [Synechococcus sp.]|nr:photosystem II complex extrinsic protein PsbU [Synechococcus sp.]
MKRLLAWLLSGVVMAGLLVSLLLPAPVLADARRNLADDKIAESAGRIDLNNCSVRRFQQFPGMYPTLAGKIVLGGPYTSVDDVLSLDLTEHQRELFDKYKDNFTVTPPAIALNEGFDRINDGQYR